MTSDQLKDVVVRKAIATCVDWLTEEQRTILESTLRLALFRMNLSEEEMALSTEVRTPNEDYLKQFLAIKMVKGLSEKSLSHRKYLT